jgi:MFS family permease
VFWILAGTFFICGLSTNGLIQTHFISLCGDAGLGPVPAASVLAMMGAFDLVGTIASGWLSDRYDNRKLLFMYYGLRGLSLLWLPYSEFTLYGLSMFAMFYGLDWIATVPPTVRLAGATFGKEKAGMVFGWIFAAHQLGAAVAAYGAGRIRTAADLRSGAVCRRCGVPGGGSDHPAGAQTGRCKRCSAGRQGGLIIRVLRQPAVHFVVEVAAVLALEIQWFSSGNTNSLLGTFRRCWVAKFISALLAGTR